MMTLSVEKENKMSTSRKSSMLSDLSGEREYSMSFMRNQVANVKKEKQLKEEEEKRLGQDRKAN